MEQLGNALTLPEHRGIIWNGRPRQYRADCQIGQFKIGSNIIVGKSLEMEVFGFRTIDDELFGYEYQTWLQVLFIDQQNVISSMLLKTESMDNFGNMRLELLSQNKAVGEGITTATMSKRSSSSGKAYFAVEFQWREREEYDRLLEIADFISKLSLEHFALPGRSGRGETVEVKAE